MKPIIQDISKISDSKELLDAKPYPFITVFIYLVMSILIGSLTWAYFSEIDIVVKANGTVRPNKKVSTITSKVSGTVDDVLFQNGKKVKKGDLLYVINHESLNVQQELLVKSLKKKEIELNNLKKFKSSILDNKNHFELSSNEQEDYYYKYLKYSLDLEKLKENTTLIITQIRNTKETINNLNTLLSSISKGENLFTNKSSEYYIKYQDYKIRINDLTNQIHRAKEIYVTQSILKEAGAISENVFNEAKNTYESSMLNLDKFKNETILNHKSTLDASKKKLEELSIPLRKTIPNEKDIKVSYDDIILDFKTKTLISINDDIKNIEIEIDTLKKNIASAKLDINNYNIKAPIDGYLNIVTDITKGDNISSGLKIATIVPSNDSQYKVQIYVPNKDISKISLGDKIKYNFYALPYKEYGKLEGTITKISVDSSIMENQSSSFYLVEADIENRPLYSYKGEQAQIKVGMVCEAQVITKTKKVLFFLLEKIDLWD